MPVPIIDNVNEIKDTELNNLVKYGFCLIRMPDNEIFKGVLNNIHQSGLDFFNQSEEFKMQWPVNEEFAGYASRYETDKMHFAQQAFFRPEEPIQPFFQAKQNITTVNQIFENEIARPLIKILLKKLNVPEWEEQFKKLTEDYFHTFSFAYYPAPNMITSDPDLKFGLKPHKDFGLITILHITKPGLEVYMDDKWQPIDPKPGYLVVNIANALEQMLGKKVTSALHRVRLPDGERLSFGCFIDPSLERPILNLFTGEKIADSGKEYLEKQFKITYSDPESQIPMAAEEYILAARAGDLDKVRRAIEKENINITAQADLMATNGVYVVGTTALHEAAANGCLDVVEYLLSKEFSIDVRTNKGWTPLHAATFNKQKEVAKYLVTQGANTKLKDVDDFSPLQGALYQGLTDLASELIDLREQHLKESNKAEVRYRLR